jgi:hypothetical protein
MVHTRKEESNAKKPQSPAKKTKAPTKHSSPSGGGGDNTPLTQKILDNANFLIVTTSEEKVPRQKVASLCGYPSETGSYKNAITSLKKKQYAEVDKDSIWLTELGREQATDVDTAKSNEEQLELAKQRVTGGKGKKLLDILSDGKAHNRLVVAEKLGTDPTKRSWLNFLAKVKKENCLEYCDDEDGKPALRLPSWIFPFPMAN